MFPHFTLGVGLFQLFILDTNGCIYKNPEDYGYYLDSAEKYSEQVLNHN
jgi:hypothetical protein